MSKFTNAFIILFFLFFQITYAQAESSSELWTCLYKERELIKLSDGTPVLDFQVFIYTSSSSEKNYTLLYFLEGEGGAPLRKYITNKFEPAHNIVDRDDKIFLYWKGLDKESRGFSEIGVTVDLKNRKEDFFCKIKNKDYTFPTFSGALNISVDGNKTSTSLKCVKHPALLGHIENCNDF